MKALLYVGEAAYKTSFDSIHEAKVAVRDEKWLVAENDDHETVLLPVSRITGVRFPKTTNAGRTGNYL